MVAAGLLSEEAKGREGEGWLSKLDKDCSCDRERERERKRRKRSFPSSCGGLTG